MYVIIASTNYYSETEKTCYTCENISELIKRVNGIINELSPECDEQRDSLESVNEWIEVYEICEFANVGTKINLCELEGVAAVVNLIQI